MKAMKSAALATLLFFVLVGISHAECTFTWPDSATAWHLKEALEDNSADKCYYMALGYFVGAAAAGQGMYYEVPVGLTIDKAIDIFAQLVEKHPAFGTVDAATMIRGSLMMTYPKVVDFDEIQRQLNAFEKIPKIR